MLIPEMQKAGYYKELTLILAGTPYFYKNTVYNQCVFTGDFSYI